MLIMRCTRLLAVVADNGIEMHTVGGKSYLIIEFRVSLNTFPGPRQRSQSARPLGIESRACALRSRFDFSAAGCDKSLLLRVLPSPRAPRCVYSTVRAASPTADGGVLTSARAPCRHSDGTCLECVNVSMTTPPNSITTLRTIIK